MRFKILSVMVLVFILIILLAPQLAPYDPLAVDMTAALEPMSATHYFGTDQLGRDVYSRVLYGGQTSLGLAFVIVVATTILGSVIGMLSALIGGKVDTFISRFIDIWLSLPELVVAIAFIGVLGPNIKTVLAALIIVKWAEYARIMRSLVVTVRSSLYIQYAYMSGANFINIMKDYVIPNVISPIIVVACQHIGEIILTVAGFSLIGIGVQPPMPEWGSILMSSKDYMQTAPWLLFCPGAAIFIAVILFNWWGDELRDVLDPHVN